MVPEQLVSGLGPLGKHHPAPTMLLAWQAATTQLNLSHDDVNGGSEVHTL